MTTVISVKKKEKMNNVMFNVCLWDKSKARYPSVCRSLNVSGVGKK